MQPHNVLDSHPESMNQEQLMEFLGIQGKNLNQHLDRNQHKLWLLQQHSQVVLNQLEGLRQRLLTQASNLATEGNVPEIEIRAWLIKAKSVKSVIDKINECNFTENDLI